MADQQASPAGPDLSKGIPASEFAGETLLGHVGDDEVLLVRSGSEIFAIGGYCSHYHGPLAEGLVTGQGIRCPWQHACFDLRTGVARRRRQSHRGLECRAGRRSQPFAKSANSPGRRSATDAPGIVIVGGGVVALPAEMLRRQDYRSIVMLSNEAAAR